MLLVVLVDEEIGLGRDVARRMEEKLWGFRQKPKSVCDPVVWGAGEEMGDDWPQWRRLAR